MYLNEKKIKGTLAYAKVQMIIGIVFVVFFGFGIVGGIVGDDALKKGLVFYILLILPFVWLLWLSVQKKRMVEQARQLNQMFCSDADGNIEASQLMLILHSKNEYQAFRTVGQLIGKGFLVNCTVEQSPTVHIALYRNKAAGVEYVKCLSCGANVEKRVGFAAVCPYCGTKLS